VIGRLLDDDWTKHPVRRRIIPNKKIEDLIRFYAAYQRSFDRRSRLLLVDRRPVSSGTSARCTIWCGG